MQWSDERAVFTVSEVVGDVKVQLESRFHDIWVQGEISNLRKPPSGHLYFTLKDDQCQLPAVFFRAQQRYARFEIEDGLDVAVRGSVSVYPPRGQLQIIVEWMEPVGRGALQLAFEQLKARLQAEGLFEPDRKKKLPLLPSRIGIVTSPSGAAIQDILRVLKRRNDRLNILIYPARVQGAEAAGELVEGIRYFNSRNDIDVIIVGRGGGSLEDLWAFNEERVARAIADSHIPVISAVGHEIDFTISDFVADLRAPTPSAAAEIVSGKREELIRLLNHLRRHHRQAIRLILQQHREKLRRLASSRAFVDAESRLRLYLQRLDELDLRLRRAVHAVFDPLRTLLLQRRKEIVRQMQFYLSTLRQIQQTRVHQLQAFSPLQVLERGYAIVTRHTGEVVRRPEQVSSGELFQVRVSGGSFQGRKESK